MAELRYNPLLDDWTMVSGSRNKRPDMPKDWCPFCPGSKKVPENYRVYIYDNDFPVLKINPQKPDQVGSDFYKTVPSYGKCDVILYSPDHNASIWQLPIDHIEELVNLWIDRYNFLRKDQKIKYIMPFENRGKEVGVTMPHPHGQIYAYSKIPLRIRTELENGRKYYYKTGENLFNKIRKEEIDFKDRIVYENNHFIAFIPFFSEYPYGVYIFPKSDIFSFSDFNKDIIFSFSDIIKQTTGAFDHLFNKKFPYMMCIYNSPVNCDKYKDVENYYLFHVKFFPPLRSENSIKWNASSETGAWAAGNPRKAEECAVELRQAYVKFLNKQ
ncbi:MAG: galactose-1-phosphate uridylyltransferase [Tissierellia bacterium]|nr:galactose-1-phosphate uridylyltransferase [Tissierellia bacterium]